MAATLARRRRAPLHAPRDLRAAEREVGLEVLDLEPRHQPAQDRGELVEVGAGLELALVQDFIDRLNADGRFKVVTNNMSTQVFGQYEEVMDALTRELKPTFERDGKAIFVMKVLGPLGQ